MGIFPYNCGICGGAYSRCGQLDKHKQEYEECNEEEKQEYLKDYHYEIRDGELYCPGGQFCFEDAVVITVKDTRNLSSKLRKKLSKIRFPLKGIYTGYGSVSIKDLDDFDFIEDEDETGENVVIVNIFCKSCYNL